MNRLLFCMLLLAFLPWTTASGQTGFVMPQGRKQVEIPFEYSNNFIILTVRFNGILPLRFIFDTGAEFTILSQKGITDMFKMPYEQVYQVAGSDLSTPLTAYLVRRVRLEIPEKAYALSEDILVLEEDYFRFEEYAGVQVHGILSANAFSRYIIKINYQRRVIQLTEKSIFKTPSDYSALPIEIYKNKVYLNTALNVQQDLVVPVKLLIDTGAGLPLLLFTNTHPLLSPPPNAIISNIGMGLGGFLEGFTGRVSKLEIGPFKQQQIVTYFQEIDTAQTLGFLNKRNGLIGNNILNHFYVILDYQDGIMWLKPNRLYKEQFLFDRSGINMIATGEKFDKFMVHNLVPNSPATEVDLRPGDIILKIGNKPSVFMTLGTAQRIFLKKPGKKVTLTVLRDGEKLKKTIVLRDLL